MSRIIHFYQTGGLGVPQIDEVALPGPTAAGGMGSVFVQRFLTNGDTVIATDRNRHPSVDAGVDGGSSMH